MRGATAQGILVVNTFLISIHAPHAGSDGYLFLCNAGNFRFQSTLPMRGATTLQEFVDNYKQFQSTLPMRGATQHVNQRHNYRNFNPRSPCGERLSKAQTENLTDGISIHAPHAGSDHAGANASIVDNQFQSTLPMRGATQYGHSPYR